MLEATDIKKRDIISLLNGALLDRICSESESCPVIKLFTEYLGLVHKAGINIGREERTAEDITKLRRDIQQFKINGVAAFSDYRKSELQTFKIHLPDHFIDDIVRKRG